MVPLSLPACTIDSLSVNDSLLHVTAHADSPTAVCPTCQHPADRVHSRYHRQPRDLPVSTMHARLCLTVRRFFCMNAACPRQTFAERFPLLVPVYAHRTSRLTQSLQSVAFALGGEAGAVLSHQLRMPTSPATLLRIIRAAPDPAVPLLRVVGVDDFAFRRGHRYGTIVIDLERQQRVDLLPDRSAATLATWLQGHPEVEIITRDRSTEYARGVTAGAPQAQQIADRWHLLVNLREALERMLTRLHAELRRLPPAAYGAVTPAVAVERRTRHPLRPASAQDQQMRSATRDQRRLRYEAVQALVADGVSQLQIAQRLGMSRHTVRRYAQAPQFPERAARARQRRMLDPYLPVLEAEWAAGCRNASALWRTIQQHGYPGVRKQIARWVQQRRTEPAATTGRNPASILERPRTDGPSLPGARQLVWLLLRDVTTLDADDQALLAQIQQHPRVAAAGVLVEQFQTMVRERTATALDAWLTACEQSGISDLKTFAGGLRRDYAEVAAAFQQPWSNGQTEGQVNRLKLIKRSMYGRGNFDLLRKRVLHAA